jgi:hypothetical protein
VEIQDHLLRAGPRDVNGDDRDPAQAGRRRGHIGGQRALAHHLLEDLALLAHLAAQVKRGVPQQLIDCFLLRLSHIRLLFCQSGIITPARNRLASGRVRRRRIIDAI